MLKNQKGNQYESQINMILFNKVKVLANMIKSYKGLNFPFLTFLEENQNIFYVFLNFF